MDLSRYQGVIKMVLEDNAGRTPDEIYDELHRSLKIAEMISGSLGNTTQPKNDVLARMQVSSSDFGALITGQQPRPQPPAPVLSMPSNKPMPILVSSAPPVAGIDDTDDPGDVDYWESKPGKGDGCARLEAAVKKTLPSSLTVQLPGFDKPFDLVLGVGSPGVRFVHISYSIPGGEMGPRVTLMTSQKDAVDKDRIVSDILNQAAAFYSKEKRVIVPKAPPPLQAPSSQEMQQMLERDRRTQGSNDGLSGEEAMKASEDAKQWADNRPSRWN